MFPPPPPTYNQNVNSSPNSTDSVISISSSTEPPTYNSVVSENVSEMSSVVASVTVAEETAVNSSSMANKSLKKKRSSKAKNKTNGTSKN